MEVFRYLSILIRGDGREKKLKQKEEKKEKRERKKRGDGRM